MRAFAVFKFFADAGYWRERIVAGCDMLAEAVPAGFERRPRILLRSDLAVLYWPAVQAGGDTDPAPRTLPEDKDLLFFFGFPPFADVLLDAAERAAHFVTGEGGALRQIRPVASVGKFVHVRADGGPVTAFSTEPAVMPLYRAALRDEFAVFANRPRLAARAALMQRGELRNRLYLHDYMMSRFSMRGQTPFAGVESVPSWQSATLGTAAVSSHPLRPADRIPQTLPLHEKGRMLAGVLCEAVDPRTTRPAVLWMSGGKDSRTLAVTLAALGRAVDSFTIDGISGEGEAARAADVAALCSFPHRTVPQPAVRDPLAAARLAIERSEGLGLNFPHQLQFDLPAPAGVNLHGHGHILRGGQARRMLRGAEAIRAALRASLYSRHTSLDAADDADRLLDAWIAGRDVADPRDLLHHFHVDHRTAAFTAANYVYMSARGVFHYPLLAQSVTHFAERLFMFDKVSERVLFAALTELGADAANRPLFRNAWRFDAMGANTAWADSDHNFESRRAERMAGDTSRLMLTAQDDATGLAWDEPAASRVAKDRPGLARIVLDSSAVEIVRRCTRPQTWRAIEALAAGTDPPAAPVDGPEGEFHFDEYLNRAFLTACMADMSV